MKISRAISEKLYAEAPSLLALPIQTQIVLESVITHLICVTQNFKEKRFEIVLGLNNPEPSDTIRHMAEQGALYCVWQGIHMQQGPAFDPDENESGLEHWEVDSYDTYLTFQVEVE